MRIHTFAAELKYVYYELCSIKRANIVLGIFIGAIYLYGMLLSPSLNTYTNGDMYMIIQFITLYILLRMILTGFSLPVNTYEKRKNQVGNLNNNGIEINGVIDCLEKRIKLKCIQSMIFNICTILILLSGWNLINDIRNYILISILICLGTYYMMTIGNIANLFMQLLGLKREFILFFEMVMFIAYNVWNSDNYFFPITIIMTQISGLFSNDLLYATFNIDEFIMYLPLWGTVMLICFVLNYFTKGFMEVVQSYDNYGRDIYEK